MTVVSFLTAVLVAPCVLGLPVAVHPTLRSLARPARLSLAWATGSLLLTVFLTLCSALGLPWKPGFVVLLGIPALVVTVLIACRPLSTDQRSRTLSGSDIWLASILFALSAAGVLFTLAFGAATSADLSYFWGAKAIHFALHRGLDFELLKQPYMIHLHPNYPLLWPVLLGWGAMVARALPWLAVPSLSWVCLTAAATVVFSAVSLRHGTVAAAAVTCLWYAVLGALTVTSFSGGNGDGPLVLFLSIGLVIVLIESDDEHRPLRWLAGVALAGAVFTKSEGMFAAVVIVIGTAARDLMWRHRNVAGQTVALVAPSIAVAGLWVAVRFTHDLPLTDPIRETAFHISFEHIGLILRMCIRILTSGVVGVAWLVPLVSLLIARPRRLTPALPAVVTALAIPLFAVVYYLHAVGDPRQLIVWTFPRLIQPAVSAWILGLGIATFPIVERRDRPTEDGARP